MTSRHIAYGRHHGTNGEFIQGQLPSGEGFHVTWGLKIYSTVKVTGNHSGVVTAPPLFEKARLAATSALKRLTSDTDIGVELEIVTHVPVAKGLGSSTADVVAAAKGCAELFGRTFSPSELAEIATEVESSDGSMYPGMVCFGQKSGRLLNSFEWLPDVATVSLDIGGTVATDSQVKRTYTAEQQNRSEQFLERFRWAHDNRNLAELTRATTDSADMNQEFLEKPQYEDFKQLAEEHRALGISTAHTGTLISAIFSPERISYQDNFKRSLRNHFPGYNLYEFSTSSDLV